MGLLKALLNFFSGHSGENQDSDARKTPAKEASSPAATPKETPAPKNSSSKSTSKSTRATSSGKTSSYDYVVVGAGPAGVVAAETLAEQNRSHGKGSILLVGGESEPPYSRMAIPYYLIGNIEEPGTYLRKTDGHYKKQGIDYKQDFVQSLAPEDKLLTLASGEHVSYGKLCLATGSVPIKPPISGLDLEGVHHCWTLEDSRHIIRLAEKGSRVVLMGAGFIGCIILEALAARGVKLTVVEMGNRMVPRMLDETSGGLIKDWCEKEGVKVHTSTRIENVSKSSEKGKNSLTISLSNGEDMTADLLVVAAGVKSNVGFLDGAGLKIGQGIQVNEHMQTSDPNIYAAGDCAESREFGSGDWSVQAIQPVAADHGRIAALNMTGQNAVYQGALGMNVLDTLGLVSTSFGQWDGVKGGETASRLDAKNYRYTRLEFKDDVLVGAQTLGRTDHVGVIRGLIQNQTPLGKWKGKLCQDPNLIMDAYVELTATP